MDNFISLFILLPLLGFLINSIIPKDKELLLSQISFGMMGTQFVFVLGYTIWWISKGAIPVYDKQFSLIHFENFEVFIDFMFDWTTAVYLLVGSFIAFLITTYSRNYLHREVGFKRFFATILFFYLGYNVIVLSCNLTTIFVGWEIAGISSFLLIAYYRNRYIPVKNAVKIFSLYRLGDVCIILAMWFGHHIWHQNISLNILNDLTAVKAHIALAPGYAIGFSLCVLTAAAIKSAQFPFSTWLSRAMEGPTPSSAIFYSSLAVHLGLLFLLRTYNFWIEVPYMQTLVIVSGATSFILGTITSRIQPSIKGQIAYAVVAQLGIMVIEVALGWHILVLVHFASHAMLRSYQLLISPSVVNYAIKKQFFEFTPITRKNRPGFIQNISNSIYILSLNEWYLDNIVYQITWGWFKKAGSLINKTPQKFDIILNQLIWILIPITVAILQINQIDYNITIFTNLLLALSLYFCLKVFTEKKSAHIAWKNIASIHVLVSCALIVNKLPYWHLSFYVGGITISYIIGHFVLTHIRKKELPINLNGYQGHCYEYPQTELMFLISCLGLMGFPITSAYLGVELLFNGIHAGQYLELGLLSMIFLINGLAMIRMYARIFLGPHIKTYHESANKSA
jgi:NADH-quinone oxidoreductase subunit L